jgi:RNA polymerase sigma-70 factor, ECF subfamily
MQPQTEASSPAQEAQWIRQIGKSDRGAFEQLYRAYERRLYRYLLGIVRAPESAEELTSDVMIEVWKNASRYRGHAKPSTWLFGIAHHKAIDMLRRRQPQVTELHAVAASADPRPGPEAAAMDDVDRRELAAAVGALSIEHREVLDLTFNVGCSQVEIAQIVGCPVNTVKTRMFYAKQQLRQTLERRGFRREIS